MKIIQTLWTAPGLNASWMDKRYHFMSWALSCLQLRKYYDDVELYTDDLGKKLLIDRFQLPYTQVHLTLNDFPYPHYLWAAPKIHSYGLQNAPFLHIDGDIFLFEPLPSVKLRRGFVYQNQELETFDGGFYTEAIHDILAAAGNPENLPGWITEAPLNRVIAVNAGVFGGQAVPFFKKHAALSFDFFDQHGDTIRRMKTPQCANHLAEQVLSMQLLLEEGIDHIGLFTPNPILTANPARPFQYVPPPEYQTDADPELPVHFVYLAPDHFGISPHGRKYMHMIGAIKGSRTFCKMLGRRLQSDYPGYYNRIVGYFGQEEDGKPRGRISLRKKVLLLPKEKVFTKTNFLCRLLTEKELPSFPIAETLPDAENLFAGIDNPDIRHRLIEAFRYETQRFQFALAYPGNEDLQDIEERSAASQDKLYDPLQPDLQEYQIRSNPHLRLVETPYNWLHDSAYTVETPESIQTHIVINVDQVTQSLVEIDLTPLNLMILCIFQDTMTYRTGLKALQEEFVVVHDIDRLEQDYFKCLAHMITNGLLLVSHHPAKQPSTDHPNHHLQKD